MKCRQVLKTYSAIDTGHYNKIMTRSTPRNVCKSSLGNVEFFSCLTGLLWSILDNNLKDRRHQIKAELFQVLQEGWNALNIDLLRRLVESMPRRIQAVIDANGYVTKY